VIGKIISHYRVIEKLGGGGMGVVYKAQDTNLDRTVALKFLPPHLLADKEAEQRFISEAKAASSLDHPNICTIYDIGKTDDDQLFIALAYYDGETLKKKIEKGPIKIEDAIDTIIQVAEGLKRAHKKGIAHRDIKPANIFITNEGIVKILDFGLAKTSGEPSITNLGSTVGTVSYMSPEQSKGEEVDHRTDIWSLGVVLYQMLSGSLPFQGDYEQAVIYSILNEQPAFPKDIPLELKVIVQKALKKDQSQRYQNVDDIVDELRLNREKSKSAQFRAINMGRKSKVFTSASITFLLVMVSVLIYLFFPTNQDSENKSIAVLPFENLSEKKENDYFSDGITEDIITQVSKISDLKVISRTSVMYYKNHTKKLHDIGRELGVATILDGSVRRVNDRVRIVAKLIDVNSNAHLWAHTYDRDLTDIFAIQSDVAQQIANALRAQLSASELERIDRKPTKNLEAYNSYLLGRFFWNQRTKDGFEKAIQYFQEAIKKDSSYALAYSGLADCYILSPYYADWHSNQAYLKGLSAAIRALELDNNLGEGHISLAYIKDHYEWNWFDAENEYRYGVELNPNYATGHHWYGMALHRHGRIKEAINEMQKALELDPFSLIINTNFGDLLYYSRNYDEAINQYEKTLEMNPNFSSAHQGLGKTFIQKGKIYEAIKEFEKLTSYRRLTELPYAYVLLGEEERAEEMLKELQKKAKQTYIDPTLLARAYMGVGDLDTAFELLEKSYQERSVYLYDMISLDPYYDLIRNDQRYNTLLEKMSYKNK